MRIPDANRRTAVGANMTPMIDVVFLLIIFFLVSSHLARQETRLPLELPVAATHDPIDPEKAPLTISVNSQAEILVGGKVVDLARLGQIMRELHDQRGDQAAIRVRSEGKVQYRFIEPILRRASIAGVTDAAIAVRQESAE